MWPSGERGAVNESRDDWPPASPSWRDLADVVEAADAAVDGHLEPRRFDGRFEQAGKGREASRLDMAAETRFRVPHFAQPQRDGITHFGRE